ncbi:hypothetical protein [Haladaptatus cibarius]|uniref:hypothetical protein n=1 Tax=Haladaptatus cibarius TaxID=453847 RepID=UPI00130EFD2E|nr:hypothetical protein [Haladaptatus cibarius]
MGIMDAMISSIIQVISGLLGFALLFGGAQQAAFGSGTFGTIVALIGIVLILFASKL